MVVAAVVVAAAVIAVAAAAMEEDEGHYGDAASWDREVRSTWEQIHSRSRCPLHNFYGLI